MSRMSSGLPDELDRLARQQHSAFTRQQALRAGGVTPLAIESRVRRGTWRRLYYGVYTNVAGTLDRETELWAAVLYAGRDAVLSHETAAELHRLTDKASRLIHLAVPADRTVTPAAGIRVHRLARVYDPPDAHRDPPHTTIEDTVLDLTDAAATLADAIGWLTSAFGRELTNEVRLRHTMAARKKIRWRSRVLDILACGESGDHSVLEYRYTRDVERPHGLPEADRQVPFRLPNGRIGRRDRVYTQYRVVIELDGRLTHPPEDKWRDHKRDRAVIIAGYQPLRYGWSDIDVTPCATAAEAATILQDRGWRGSIRPCTPACTAMAIAASQSAGSIQAGRAVTPRGG
jgi:hypothetical protein